MNRAGLFCWFGIFATSILPMRAATRTWTNTEGVKIQADFIKAEGDMVTLRLANGKQVSFSQGKLSAQDREFVRTAPSQPAASSKATVGANRTPHGEVANHHDQGQG